MALVLIGLLFAKINLDKTTSSNMVNNMKLTKERATKMVDNGGYFLFMFSYPWGYDMSDRLTSTLIEQYHSLATKEMYGENWKVTLPQYGVEIEDVEEKEIKGLFGGVRKVKSVTAVSYYLYFSTELTKEEIDFYRAFKLGWLSGSRFWGK